MIPPIATPTVHLDLVAQLARDHHRELILNAAEFRRARAQRGRLRLRRRSDPGDRS